MAGISFGERLKQLRLARGWTQGQLAQKAGLSRTAISSTEQRKSTRPSADALLKLANAFGIPAEELYEAVGYETGGKGERHVETPEEILERLKLAQPVTIPVYSDFPVHAGEERSHMVDYIYRPRQMVARHNIEAYLVRGRCMEPKISDGDIVVVDRDVAPEEGDITLCLVNSELVIGKLQVGDREAWVENSVGRHNLKDCKASAVVIEVVKRLR